MGYALSFAPEFFWGDGSVPREDLKPSRRPKCVYQALISLSEHEWNSLAHDVFHCPPESLDLDLVMRQILQTDTCRNLDNPVEVFIDPEGWYRLLIY